MSEHHFSTGGGFRSIAWSPQAAVELILEIDGRWAAPAIIQEAQKCWKSLAAVSASKLALQTIDIGDIFGARQVHADPFPLWQARTRQTRELAEKLLVASGREACFHPSSSTSRSSFGRGVHDSVDEEECRGVSCIASNCIAPD